jgi:hypothetical protein
MVIKRYKNDLIFFLTPFQYSKFPVFFMPKIKRCRQYLLFFHSFGLGGINHSHCVVNFLFNWNIYYQAPVFALSLVMDLPT